VSRPVIASHELKPFVRKQVGIAALTAFLIVPAISWQTTQAAAVLCSDVFSAAKATQAPTHSGISTQELLNHVETVIPKTPEFVFIRDLAHKMKIRVWLFGGTAASFTHYVKWDLARKKGLLDLQADRFDYDYTNIFRSTQDLDIVVDAPPDLAARFQEELKREHPHFLGEKDAKWEVRSLKHRRGQPGEVGFKEALLNDLDFTYQNTDSNSLAMVEISKSKEPKIRDLKSWNEQESTFVDDVLENQITYLRNPNHFKSARARLGENPEILSVLRVLVKAFQYDLMLTPKSEQEIRAVLRAFRPQHLSHSVARQRFEDTAEKLAKHSVNLEMAYKKLDELGLRDTLIKMGDAKKEYSFAWWLNREPLPSRPVGEGNGRTAKQLGLDIVAHETVSFLAYEAITRAHSGEPNVFKSRRDAHNERAFHGDGFYTRVGREGATGSGMTIRFRLAPDAREGTDFRYIESQDYVVVLNKRALTVIHESLKLTLPQLILLARSESNQLHEKDRGLIEKLKRKINAATMIKDFERLMNSREPKDLKLFKQVVTSLHLAADKNLIPEKAYEAILKHLLERFTPKAKSNNHRDIVEFVQVIGSLSEGLDKFGIVSRAEMKRYLISLIQSSRASFELRREAFFELILLDESSARLLDEQFSASEATQIEKAVFSWEKQTFDPRKSRFFEKLDSKVIDFIADAPWAEQKPTEDQAIELIQNLFFYINAVDANGKGVLFYAISHGWHRMLDVALKHKDIDLHLQTKNGDTPMIWSILKADVYAFKKLLGSKQIDVNLTNPRYKWSPMDYIIRKGLPEHDEMLNLLVRDPRLKFEFDSTKTWTFLAAAGKGLADAVKVLVKRHKANINGIGLANGPLESKSAIERAVVMGHLEIIQFLIEQPGLHINSLMENHDSILHLAVRARDPEVLKILLKRKDLRRDHINREGLTALDLARQTSDFEAIKILEQDSATR